MIGKGVESQPGELREILGGILALDSNWVVPLGDTFTEHLADDEENRLLNIGCIASKGMFVRSGDEFQINTEGKHATRFLFRLIEMLQKMGTVPAIEMHKYEPFLSEAHEVVMEQEA